jgi:hypothetical protein
MIYVISKNGLSHDMLMKVAQKHANSPATEVIPVSQSDRQVDSFIKRSAARADFALGASDQFILYGDYYLNPRINEILRAIYDYKMRLQQDLRPFAHAVVLTDKRTQVPAWLYNMVESITGSTNYPTPS